MQESKPTNHPIIETKNNNNNNNNKSNKNDKTLYIDPEQGHHIR